MLVMFPTLIPADVQAFDNLLNFTPVNVTRITDHPVEFGADVSDNAQVLPVELIFSAQVTGTPTIPVNLGIELATAWFERNNGKQLTITAPAGVFTGFIMSRWSYDEAPGQRVFSVTAREVRIAAAISVPIPPRLPAPDAANGLESAANAGVQPPVVVPPPSPTSFLATLSALL